MSIMFVVLHRSSFFSSALSAFAQRVQLLERGGVLFPGRIVVDGKDAGVVARLEDGARDQRRRRRCARGRRCVRWPRMPAPPPIVQCAPMVALPATPAQPAIAVCLPMRTLWPIWIRLSSFTPSSITVSCQRAAVDAGVGADLDVVADAHRAQLLDLFPARPACGREAEAVGADHHAGMQDAALADRRSPRPRVTRGLEHGAGADARAALDHAQRRRCGPSGSTTRVRDRSTALGWMRRPRRPAPACCFHSWVTRAKYR